MVLVKNHSYDSFYGFGFVRGSDKVYSGFINRKLGETQNVWVFFLINFHVTIKNFRAYFGFLVEIIKLQMKIN